jgi:hypothetical protein
LPPRAAPRADRDRAGDVDAIDVQIAPLDRELRQLAPRQAGRQALMGLYGMSS